MLLMVEKGIRGGICYAIYRRHVTANNKYTKNQDKKKKHRILCTWMQIIYTDGQCLKKYLQMVFNGKEICRNLMKSL